MQPVKVVYLMSYTRSGTTLVGNILGEIDGFFHAGELRNLWARTIQGRPLCGCRARLDECTLWSKVVSAVLEGAGGADIKTVRRQQRKVLRLRHLRHLLSGEEADAPDETAAYARATDLLYRQIAEETGSGVIVDSSKRIADAALLRWLPSVEPYYVQIVRDPRAVVHSWQRIKAAAGEGRRDELDTLPPSTAARGWIVFAAGAAVVRKRHGGARSMLVRYEDFAAQPRRFVEAIIEMVGEAPQELPFIDDHSVELGPNHTVGGNPNRHQSGATIIRTDDEWIDRQPLRERLMVTTMALPLLVRYRYPIRPSARVAGRPEAKRAGG